jgi:hypothetical protein
LNREDRASWMRWKRPAMNSVAARQRAQREWASPSPRNGIIFA